MNVWKFKNPVLSGVAFFTTVGMLSVGYSAYVAAYPATAAPTNQLSSTEWNKMVAAIQTLDTNLSAFTVSGGNVGIGTAPNSKLSVNGNIATMGYGIVGKNLGTAPVTGAFIAGNNGSNDGGYGLFYGSNAINGADDRRGNVDIGSYAAGGTPGTINFLSYNGTGWNVNMTVLPSGNVGIGTSNPIRKLHVAGDEQLDGDLYGGLYGGTRGIWRFSSADPNFGIFYTEASPDYISFSPNGGGTGSPVMTVSGNGVGIWTNAPTEKLEINGNLKFTGNGSVISKAPRSVHSTDPVAGCPAARAANTDLWTMPITLDRASTVLLTGDTVKNAAARADLQLFLDGTQLMQTIAPAVASDWVGAHVQWTGTVSAGVHTVSLRSPQSGVWWCWAIWWTMDALIFEN